MNDPPNYNAADVCPTLQFIHVTTDCEQRHQSKVAFRFKQSALVPREMSVGSHPHFLCRLATTKSNKKPQTAIKI